MLITTNTTHAANQHLYKTLTYRPVEDYAPLTLLGKGGQIMVVNPNSAAKSVGDFIAQARQSPGKLSFGSGSSSSRIAGELLQQMANVQLLHVPYKSNPLAVTDLLGGQIDMMITDTATGLPQVKSGKLRALGVTGLARSPLAPEVPTIAEAGVPGYEMGYWFAAYAGGHAAGRGQASERTAGQGHAKRAGQAVLCADGHRPRQLHARRAGPLPAGGSGEMGRHHQESGDPARVSTTRRHARRPVLRVPAARRGSDIRRASKSPSHAMGFLLGEHAVRRDRRGALSTNARSTT